MHILRFFKKFVVNDQKILLGRWGINSCQNKVNTKVDLSNEDHCGPCSYTQKKDNINIKNISDNEVKTKEEIYNSTVKK